MKFPDLTLTLALVLVSTLFPPTANAGNVLLHKLCSSTGTYTANSTYDLNLQTLLTKLTTSATNSSSNSNSNSNFGFAKSTFGSIPNQILGLVLCRGDVNSSYCSFCLSQATQQIQTLCPYFKEATFYYEVCLLHFSNQDFLFSTDNSHQYIKWNDRNITGSQTLYDSYLNYLLNTTADYAAFNSSKKFGAAKLNLSSKAFPETYGLVQCTPDMSSSDCASCLNSLIGEMPKQFSGKVGGRILDVRCNIRYEVYLFYRRGAPFLSLTPPAENAPAPALQGKKKTSTGTIILAITIPLVLVFIVIAGFSVCLLKRRKSGIITKPFTSGKTGIRIGLIVSAI